MMKKLLPVIAVFYFLLLAFLYWELDVVRASTEEVSFADIDLYTFFYPLSDYGRRAVTSWNLPLWNPYQSLGVPYLGTSQFGLFYPLNLLYYILPAHLAMGYTTALHIALGGLFTYIFLNLGLRTGRLSALVGATSYMLSGPVLLEITHPAFIKGMAWLPLALFFAEKLFSDRKPLWAVLLGIALALQVLTTAIHIFVFTVYTLAAYTLFRAGPDLYRARRVALSPFLYLSASLLLAFLLSSIQWLPMKEASGLSVRSTGGIALKDVEIFRESLTPANIVRGLVAPGLGGLHVGILPFLLSLPAFFSRPRRPFALFFLSWFVLTLFLSFGTHMPIYGFYYHYVPTGDWFRVPMRFAWLSVFSVSVTAALGSDVLLRRFEARRMVMAALTLLLLAIVIDLFHTNVRRGYHHPQENPGVFKAHSEEGEFLRKVQGNLRTYISNTDWVDFSMSQKFGTLEKVFVLNDYETLSLSSYREFVGGLLGDRSISGEIFYGSYRLKDDARSLRLMNLLSVGFVMEKGARVFGAPPPEGIRLVYRKNGVRVYENANALPRCYIVYGAEVIRGREEALQRLSDAGFNPRSAVILEEETGLDLNAKLPLLEVKEITYLPERVKVRVENPGNGVLVLTDFHYPGWRAYLDGKEVKILRANYLMRGIPIKEGVHEVTFVYDPVPFKAGSWVSSLSLISVLAYLGYKTGKYRGPLKMIS